MEKPVTDRKQTKGHTLSRNIGRKASQPTHPNLLILRPMKGLQGLRLRELWQYHELLYFLTWRNIKLRYKQTMLGAAWAIIQPFFTMVVFSIFFGKLAGISSDGMPYPLFAYAALVPWTYFASTLAQASNSLVEHEHMINKVYFPRLLVPIAAVLTGLIDFGIAFVLLIGMMLYYNVTLTAAIWTVPLFVALSAMTALAVGLWLAVLNVEYRDIRYAVPFIIQFWLFATPIAYPSSLVPPGWRALYGINPMVGVVDGFRWALLGTVTVPWATLTASTLSVIALMVGGLFYFRRSEMTFADVI